MRDSAVRDSERQGETERNRGGRQGETERDRERQREIGRDHRENQRVREQQRDRESREKRCGSDRPIVYSTTYIAHYYRAVYYYY